MKDRRPGRESLLPIERRSTVKDVEGLLRGKILAGWFTPGDPLRESVLALELRVSRNTVREALRGLVAGGLVQHNPDQGFAVPLLDVHSVTEILTLRGWVEQLAVTRALPEIVRRTPSLARIVDDIARAARRRDWQVLYESDLQFHSTIVNALGSPRLDQFHRILWEQLRLVLVMHDRKRSSRSAYDDRRNHEILIEAFATDSPTAACAAIADHLSGTLKMLGLEGRELNLSVPACD
jgi:DNA-binding GntR family transcriptional regulator